ncbi:acyl-CoA thioesterase [Formosa algae]|uniref:Acyl-CoA thioester hydrolase n=1 Tax=Formosa algae TaxID=225843 RepID=A0A9X0YKR3_9FLAO|nr:acyl-CoA thioesterase [Formosa algae]MBP1840371.1 acyl-CoA thioester hydrolase [Formosa algae]MDQ0334235.1 acyl-CoA thioester hydrolase [Formosa algae]OEI82227.1 thioesterase [Formosa algae]PNW29566.1 thioesterase [Formosa algae]
MYTKQFEIRWSDIDANRHLANSAYTNFMSHTRMAFLLESGFSSKDMAKHNIGPVVFYEHMYYFKEAFLGQPITVGLEVSGISEDGRFFKFEHNFYNDKGENLAHCEMLGGWIDLKERKLTSLPEVLMDMANAFPKTEDFKVLTKADTRVFNKVPKPLKK